MARRCSRPYLVDVRGRRSDRGAIPSQRNLDAAKSCGISGGVLAENARRTSSTAADDVVGALVQHAHGVHKHVALALADMVTATSLPAAQVVGVCAECSVGLWGTRHHSRGCARWWCWEFPSVLVVSPGQRREWHSMQWYYRRTRYSIFLLQGALVGALGSVGAVVNEYGSLSEP